MMRRDPITGEQPMVIQLNLPALERLLGGDSEMEVHLRQQVAEEFANKHLKKVIKEYTDSEGYKANCMMLRGAVKEWLDARMKGDLDPQSTAVNNEVKWKISTAIDAMVKERVDAALKQFIGDKIEYDSRYRIRQIDDAIKKVMDETIEQRIQQGVADRLNHIMGAFETAKKTVEEAASGKETKS